MLSRESAASLALYLAIAHPGIFDAFIGTLPGAVHTLGRFGFFGDDGDDASDDLDFDTSDDDSDYENDDGSLQMLDTSTDDGQVDDSNINENLRELGVAVPADDANADTATYGGSVTPVPGSAADTGNLGVVPGSSADPLSQSLSASDLSIPDLNDVTPDVQSISSSNAVQSIGAPAVAAATQAIASPSGLAAVANAATAYLNNQAAQGAEATALQEQANNIGAQLEMAAIDHPATGVTYVTGANGQQVPVLANASTGAPLIGANGQYIPAATGAGILSALTSGSALGPILIIGGIGLLLLLVLGHHPQHGGSGTAHASPRRGPRFIEVE